MIGIREYRAPPLIARPNGSYGDQLMEEAVRMMQSQLRVAPTIKKRAKSVYSQR